MQAWLGNTQVWVLFALVAVQSGAFAVNSPARSAIIPRLLEPRLMPAANALQTLGFSVAFTVGPLLGAVLVDAFDYGIAYTVDAAPVHRRPVRGVPAARRSRRCRRRPVGSASGSASVVDGFRYLGTQRNVRMTFAVDLVAMITSSPRVLFPAVGLVYLGGGATTTGVMAASAAVGVVLAGLFSGGLARIRWQGRIIAVAITVWGLAIAGFGLMLVLVGGSHPDQVLWFALAVAVLMLVVAGGQRRRSARCSARRSCRPRPPTTCAAGCRACSSSSSRADRGWARRCSAGRRRRSARAGPR